MALWSCIRELKAASEAPEEEVSLPWVHLAYQRFRSRLQNFSRILTIYPQVLHSLTEAPRNHELAGCEMVWPSSACPEQAAGCFQLPSEWRALGAVFLVGDFFTRHVPQLNSEMLRTHLADASHILDNERFVCKPGTQVYTQLTARASGGLVGGATLSHALPSVSPDPGRVCRDGLHGDADERHPEAQSPGVAAVGEESFCATGAHLFRRAHARQWEPGPGCHQGSQVRPRSPHTLLHLARAHQEPAKCQACP